MSFAPRHKGSFRPINREYAKAIKLAGKAPLAEPAIRKLERDRDGLQKRATLAHQLAASARRAGDAEEAELQEATAATHEAGVAEIDVKIAELKGGTS